MPLIKIVTNVPKSKIPADFLERLLPVMAAAIHKPAEKCCGAIEGDARVCFGNDSKTAGAVATIVSIGNLGPTENILISKRIAEFLEKEIGVPPKRFFISFNDNTAWNVGIGGTTAQDRDAKLKQ